MYTQWDTHAETARARSTHIARNWHRHEENYVLKLKRSVISFVEQKNQSIIHSARLSHSPTSFEYIQHGSHEAVFQDFCVWFFLLHQKKANFEIIKSKWSVDWIEKIAQWQRYSLKIYGKIKSNQIISND